MAHPHERRSGGGLDRREFLLRSLGAAVALPSASAILAACAKPGEGGTGSAGAVGTGGVDLGGPYPIPTADSPVTCASSGVWSSCLNASPSARSNTMRQIVCWQFTSASCWLSGLLRSEKRSNRSCSCAHAPSRGSWV